MTAAEALYREQAAIIRAAVGASAGVWADLDPSRMNASWVQQQIGTRLELTLARAQELAAFAADVYTDLILLEQGVEVDPEGKLRPSSLAGVASDGRDLAGLLLQPLISSQRALALGMSPQEAMRAGASALARIAGTQIADVGRASSHIGIATRQKVGWTRLVEPGACSRCVVLAGRFYRWSNGFDRHPLCKCRNIPASEEVPGLRPDNEPMTHFNSLSETEQNRQFTKAGAQAIRDGADISQVVNSRRGAMGLSTPGRLDASEKKTLRDGGRLARTDIYGRQLYITREGTTRRGVAGKLLIEEGGSVGSREQRGDRLITRARSATPRLMPESIYEIATDRDDAIRLLRRHGYIT